MKTFRLKANVTLQAEDLDDAFRILSEYYAELARGEDDAPSPYGEGSITIEPDDPNGRPGSVG